MSEIYQSTDFKTPFVFILSPGADPLSKIEKFAAEKEVDIKTISLG